jgi:hypothetical protein
MNGKRARALNRVRAGVPTIDDIQRLQRTEVRPGPEPKTEAERKAKSNGLTTVMRAVRRVLR